MEPPPNFLEQSDEELVTSYRQGHSAAFRILVNRYQNELYHFLIRFTGDRALAEDLFQETFLQVHLSAESFDVDRRFKPWLFTIAANKARDLLRRTGRRPTTAHSAPVQGQAEEGQTYSDLLEANLPLPDEEFAKQETRDLVQKVVQELPDHLRQILILAYFQQFAYRDIAQMLGVPLGTVKSRLHAAVGTFAQKWKELQKKSGESR